jgi:apolipoprotein N-acyltransferase
MVRSANNGVTCFVDHLGRVRQTLADADGDIFSEGVLSAEVEVPVNPPTTFYMKYGEAFSAVCLAATFALLGIAAVRPRPLTK